jgi:hypothetical protein
VAVNPVDPRLGGVRHVAAPVARRATQPGAAQVDRLSAYGSAMGDAVDGAFADLAVAAALVRYAADTATRNGRRVLPHPITETAPVVRRALQGPLVRALAHPATTAVRALGVVADELVPDVTRAVLARLDVPALVREFIDVDRLAAMLDVDAVVARVDFDAVVDRLDIDAIAARLDIDAVLDRLDLNAVAARLDLDTLVDKVDIARVIDRVDLDAVVAQVDLDAAVARVDIDAVVDRVDLDRAVAKVDLDRAVDRVDVDRVIARTDLAGLARYVVQEIDLPGLLRASTGTVSAEVARSVRVQGADADRAVERVVDRLLHRQGRRTGAAGGTPDGGAHDHR